MKKLPIIILFFLITLNLTAMVDEYVNLSNTVTSNKRASIGIYDGVKSVNDFSKGDVSEKRLMRIAEIFRVDIIERVMRNLPLVLSKIKIDNVKSIASFVSQRGFCVMEDSIQCLKLRSKYEKTLSDDDIVKLSVFTPLMDEDLLSYDGRNKLFSLLFKDLCRNNYELSQKNEKYSFECCLFVLFLQEKPSWFPWGRNNQSKKNHFYCLCGAIRKYLEVMHGIDVERDYYSQPSSYCILSRYNKFLCEEKQ